MIKIMIVDDMPIFREYLVNFIDWRLYGFEICYQAKNGKEALEKFSSYYPDIVLTDITMPYMDGLKLSEELLKQYTDVSIVIITGNSEFEYARKAVKLGLCDYIVKPFEKEELILTLLKLKDNINKVLETQTQKDYSKAKQREMELRKLIYANSFGKSSSIDHGNFLVITISAKKYEDLSKVEMILKWEEIIINMLKSMVEIKGKKDIFKDFEGHIVMILNFDTEKELREYQTYPFEDLIKLVKEHLQFDLLVGISDYCFNKNQIKELYHQTLRALGNDSVHLKTKLLDYKKMHLIGESSFYSWDVIERINTYLETLSYEKIEECIKEALEDKGKMTKGEWQMMMCTSLLSLLFSFIVKIGRNIDDIFGLDFRPYEILNKSDSIEQRIQFILESYSQVIAYQRKNKETRASVIAENARQYIEQHYANSDLNIGDISKKLLVNQTYLRQMFKSEIHMTISEFLTKTRMEKAKKLINDNVYKLTAIAEMVGYSDASYFSKCFKKYYGISPSSIVIKR